jgi:hypothetical protein
LLMANMNRGPAKYDPSNFNLPSPMGADSAYGMANNLPGMLASMLGPAQGVTNNIMQGGGTDVSSMLPALSFLLSGRATPNYDLSGVNAAQGGLMGSAPIAQMLAMTGGNAMSMLPGAIQGIGNAGNIAIQRQLADIRQQYGAQGLGQGSDVNYALANGAALGQANIAQNQSSLLAQIMPQIAQVQLGGLNALQGMYGTAGNLALQGQQLGVGAQQAGFSNLINALSPGLNILSTPVQQQLAAAGLSNQMAGTMASGTNSALQALLGLAGINNNANQFTSGMQYQNFTRESGLNPYLQAALGYGTQFPPIQNALPSTGATLGGSAIGAAGSILGAVLPWLLL